MEHEGVLTIAGVTSMGGPNFAGCYVMGGYADLTAENRAFVVKVMKAWGVSPADAAVPNQ